MFIFRRWAFSFVSRVWVRTVTDDKTDNLSLDTELHNDNMNKDDSASPKPPARQGTSEKDKTAACAQEHNGSRMKSRCAYGAKGGQDL